MRIALLLLVLLAGCQRTVQPPTIRYGEDVCAQCRMIINEAPYACAVETQEGEIRKYDDFNCMFLDSERIKPKRYWVHRHDKPDEWLDGTKAYYVRADDLQTPMGSRTLAVATREEAERKAQQLKGKVFTFEGIRQELRPKR
ncbi:MAG: nitrous oxide reductase accessory protein NosL [Armatimonadota bacterium]